MKKYLMVVSLVLFAFVSSAAPKFGFTYTFGACSIAGTIDTEKQTITGRNGAIEMKFVDGDLKAIQKKINKIDFWKYPDGRFRPEVLTGVSSCPCVEQTMTVVDGNRTKTITWIDSDLYLAKKDPLVIKLKELVDLIEKTARRHPAWKNLPVPSGGCA